MCTSRKAAIAPLGPNDSFFLKDAPATAVKGVIANGCNTFSYRGTRMWLRETFPNAVIFGFLAKTRASPGEPTGCFSLRGRRRPYRPLPRRPAFWRDPKKRFLKSDGTIDTTVVTNDLRELNVIYAKATLETAMKAELSIMIDKTVFRWNLHPRKVDLDSVIHGTMMELPLEFLWGKR